MKFTYYLTDDYGNISGTNSYVAALAAWQSGEFAVIDAKSGQSFEEGDTNDDQPYRADIPEYGSEGPEVPPLPEGV